ncbi:TolC family protein [Flavobacterium dankookense]|uniref:Outer membrane protein n=1 Tax=Flavobacterium dankookense TaxID=706186 RepID=A0A4V3CS06_9FLAO|nr:TolC family protein [Flavobacterium dankookense]TDP58742.1 outer membrane protein [Flavobacterium dankookense]
MNKKAFLLVFIYTLCFSVFGQENSWPLQKCIYEAMKNSIDIKISQLQVKKSQKLHNSIANQMLPAISFTGNQSYNFGSTIDPSTNGRVSSNIQNDNFFLNAQMNLIDFKNFAMAQKTKIDIEKDKADLAVIENEYQLQIVESYYQALFTQELLKIQTAQFKNSEFNLSRIQKEVEIGSKPKSDLYDMQLSFAQEEIKILETEQLFLIQKKQLFQLMNVENSSINNVVLEYFIEKKPSESSIDDNPKIRAAELGYQSSLKDTKLERANNLPTLTTFYGFSTFYYKPLNQPDVTVDNFNKQISDNKNQQLGIQLNVPVFNGFRNNRRVSAAKIEAEKSKFIIEQEKLKIKNQIDIETQNKINLGELETKLAQMKTFADASFRTSQSKFTSGVIDAVVFSAVKNQLLSTEYDLLKNQLQRQFTDVKIHLIQGKSL